MELLLALALAAAKPKPSPTPRPQPFAVVELFTSEGCSSCPPADKALADLVDEAETEGRWVFPLSCHVDYWDDQGWKDPFSDRLHSERQKLYARTLKSRVATPQFVINGTEALTGAGSKVLNAAVKRALRAPVHARVEIKPEIRVEPREVLVNYKVFGISPEALLRIVAYESRVKSKVEKGENAGQELSHANVVRIFYSQELDEGSEGRVLLKIPYPAEIRNIKLVAYAQDMRTLKILAASGG